MNNTSSSKTNEQLTVENHELRSRLAEAEEVLSAIRSGEVDAIVVSGTDQKEQVYSISSADAPYRNFVEEMQEGAITLSKEGLIMFCNARFAELVQEPVERVIGSYFTRFIAPDDVSRFAYLLSGLTRNKNEVQILSLLNSVYLKLAIHVLPPHLQANNCIIIATDISELIEKTNELVELHRQLQQHFAQLRDLRIELISAKIEAESKNVKLEEANKRLLKEVDQHNLPEITSEEILTQNK